MHKYFIVYFGGTGIKVKSTENFPFMFNVLQDKRYFM